MKGKKKVLGDLSISLMEFGDITLSAVQDHPSLTLLCSGMELTKPVDTFGGVMGFSTLIHVGDFVKYCDQGSVTAQVLHYDDKNRL